MKFSKLTQPSTWAGILALVTAFGVQLQPEQAAAIATAGATLSGVIATFLD